MALQAKNTDTPYQRGLFKSLLKFVVTNCSRFKTVKYNPLLFSLFKGDFGGSRIEIPKPLSSCATGLKLTSNSNPFSNSTRFLVDFFHIIP